MATKKKTTKKMSSSDKAKAKAVGGKMDKKDWRGMKNGKKC